MSPLESNSRGGLLACCYNFLKMKESERQLLLGAHMDAAILPAALWQKVTLIEVVLASAAGMVGQVTVIIEGMA